MPDKKHQTPAERAQINESVVNHLKALVKNLPIEVLGHIEAPALCCSGGTVALVKVDQGDPAPRT
jgi:hypothetical protein